MIRALLARQKAELMSFFKAFALFFDVIMCLHIDNLDIDLIVRLYLLYIIPGEISIAFSPIFTSVSYCLFLQYGSSPILYFPKSDFAIMHLLAHH